jgi:hypothetical protein
VPTSIRSFSQLAALRSALTRRLALVLLSITTLTGALLLAAAPAGAVVTVVASTKVGLQPRDGTNLLTPGEEPSTFANETGNVVLHGSVGDYAIYWDPEDQFTHEWLVNLDGSFRSLGEAGLDTPFGVLAQYRDRSNAVAPFHALFKGSYSDTIKFPSGKCTDPVNPSNPCLTDAQLREQLQSFIATHSLPKGMSTVYYLITPPEVTVCLDKGGPEGHCSDFPGTTAEIAGYEEAERRYPAEKGKYEKELLPKYNKELATYNEAKEKYEAELEVYVKTKEKDENASPKIPDTEAKPVAPTEPTKPVKPVVPTEPASYKDYKNSFCSYHSDINPDSAPEGNGNTILYSAIPWTAYTTAFDCQDGGWNPEKGEEKREEAKELSIKEEEARKKTLEEDTPKKRAEEEEARQLEGPHIEEPNQEGKSEDGGYTAGLTDLLVNQIAEEEMNTVTDPLLDSWQDKKGNEATDLCRNFFASTAGEDESDGEIAGSVTPNKETQAGTLSNVTLGAKRYYINNVFSRATGGCSGGLGLIARFTAPNPVNAGEIIGVDGMESTLSLIDTDAFGPVGPPTLTFGTFSWNFGDGTPEVKGFVPGAPICEAPWLSPCAASAFHSYQYGGKYSVTLTITDVDGDTTSVTHEVVVNGPAKPEEGSGGGGPGSSAGSSTATAGSSGTSGSSSSGSAPSGTVTPAKPIPGPVASAAVVSRSLATVLKKGLVISYSVNEQVAGQFQVLLASSLAKRIGLHGPAATGLAPGSAPSIVIGKAILVTTKGGRNTVKILFGKQTAAKLRRLGSVPLTIRLIVRNASSHSPQTTTVISTVTLSR